MMADHDDTDTDKDERKPAATAATTAAVSRRRSQNPFSLRNNHATTGRDNFPNLDVFLASSSTPPSSSAPMIEPAASFPSHHDDDDDDEYFEEESILNMSIGARAALAEHMRHIAIHGIDGESSLLHMQAQQQDDHNAPKSILDQKWEYFLGQHSTAHHLDVSTSTKTSSPQCQIFANTSGCFEQSIEVMTDIGDTSQDYFNSSRVHELSTPERNRDRVNYVSTRNESIVEDDDDYFLDDDEEERPDTLAPELLVIQPSLSLSTSSEEQRQNSSHAMSSSFCAPDISRISSADDDDSHTGMRHHRGSPNTSFPFHPHLQLDEDPHPLARVDDLLGSPFFLQGSSPVATELGAHPHHHPHHRYSFGGGDDQNSSFASLPSIQRTNLSPSSFGVIPHLSPRRSHSAPILARSDDDVSGNKENVSSCTNTNGSLQRRLGTKGKESSSSSSRHRPSAFDTLATDFLGAIERDRVGEKEEGGGGALSPISQVGSSHVGRILYESSSSSSSRARRRLRGGTLQDKHHNHHHGHRMAPYPPIVATMPTQDTSTSSSSSSSLTGRKRFRTVVPRRVYMDSSPSQFPDEHDSFGNTSNTSRDQQASSNSHDSPAQRSLLDSFEAVLEAGEEEEDEPQIIGSGCSACYSSY